MVELDVVATVVVVVHGVGCLVVDDIGRVKRGHKVVVGSCFRCYVFRCCIDAGGVFTHKNKCSACWCVKHSGICCRLRKLSSLCLMHAFRLSWH